jgi:hypothetical protein
MPRIATAALVLACAGLLAACAYPAGSTSASSSNRAIPTARTSRSALPHATAAPAPSHSAARTPDPGSLPQTAVRPSGSDPQFAQRMRALWAAIVSGDTAADTAAGRSFFPLGAYLQVKAISNPAADYRNRLIALYDLDIRALHLRVGRGATLLGVDVPDRSATWVTPGQEYNTGSYWRVYRTRVRYRTAAGQEGSFGIFSLISWSGQWYVVHLGPINRTPGAGAITP